MSATTTLTLTATRLFWHESARCTARLSNAGPETLRRVNAKNRGAAATLVLTCDATGEQTRISARAKGAPDDRIVDLGPGAELSEVFQSSSKLVFAAPGKYTLSAEYHWEGEWGEGRASSAPVSLEILPTRPRAACVVPGTGGPAVTLFCAWVDDTGEAPSLWRTTMGTSPHPRLLESAYLCQVPEGAIPVLSVPPRVAPWRRYVAWLHGASLSLVAEDGGLASPVLHVPFEAQRPRIVPPLLEGPSRDGSTRYADVLVVSDGPEDAAPSWRMRLFRLAPEGLPQVADDVEVGGSPPVWSKTVYRQTSERRTFFITPVTTEDGPAVWLLVSAWNPAILPRVPYGVAAWPGALVAADVALDRDDYAPGAVLVDRHAASPAPPPGQARYAIHTFCQHPDDTVEQTGSVALAFPLEAPIEQALVRASVEGDVCVVLRAEGRWYWARRDGVVHPLGELEERLEQPLDVLFQRKGALSLVHVASGSGLAFAPLTAKATGR